MSCMQKKQKKIYSQNGQNTKIDRFVLGTCINAVHVRPVSTALFST